MEEVEEVEEAPFVSTASANGSRAQQRMEPSSSLLACVGEALVVLLVLVLVMVLMPKNSERWTRRLGGCEMSVARRCFMRTGRALAAVARSQEMCRSSFMEDWGLESEAEAPLCGESPAAADDDAADDDDGGAAAPPTPAPGEWEAAPGEKNALGLACTGDPPLKGDSSVLPERDLVSRLV